MTVVSAMKFDSRTAALVTDERGSYWGGRQSDMVEKIYRIGNDVPFALVGTVGSANFAIDAMQLAQDYTTQEQGKVKSRKDIANLIGLATTTAKRHVINGYLHSAFGLHEADFIRGLVASEEGKPVPIDQAVKQRYERIIDGADQRLNDILANMFLVLAVDGQEVNLYSISTASTNPWPVPIPYACFGSGADASDTKLREYTVQLPRAKRSAIDPIEGLIALLDATANASEANVGVGGTPHIRLVQGAEIITASEVNSRLAMEVVQGGSKEFLPESFVRRAVEALVLRNGDFDSIEDEMLKTATDSKGLNRLLRGYHVRNSHE